jgi:hypothetical protein
VDGGVTQDDLYAAWRRATEKARAGAGDPLALTAREICEFVLGWPLTEHYLRRTRRMVRQWLERGLVETGQRITRSIKGHDVSVPAYRLTNDVETLTNEAGQLTNGN